MRNDLPERIFRPTLHRFKVLGRHLPVANNGARWLDLGGGAGEFSLVAAEKGYDVTLVDGDPRNISSAEDRGIHGVFADLNDPLPGFADSSFDGVSLIEVVEHIPMAERLMAEASRLVKSGGILLLSTPNAVWWPERQRILLGRPMASEGYHYRFFNVAGVRDLCSGAGFEVCTMEFSSPAFGVNWLRRRLLRRDKRKHVPIPRMLAGLLAQTVYVVGRKP